MAYGLWMMKKKKKKFTFRITMCECLYKRSEKPGTNSKNRQPLHTSDRHYPKGEISLMFFTLHLLLFQHDIAFPSFYNTYV